MDVAAHGLREVVVAARRGDTDLEAYAAMRLRFVLASTIMAPTVDDQSNVVREQLTRAGMKVPVGSEDSFQAYFVLRGADKFHIFNLLDMPDSKGTMRPISESLGERDYPSTRTLSPELRNKIAHGIISETLEVTETACWRIGYSARRRLAATTDGEPTV